MELNYIRASKGIWWSLEKSVKIINARNMEHIKQEKII